MGAQGGSFNSRLSHAAAVVAPALQLQCPCPADPQACPALAQQTCHPVVGKAMYSLVLIGCLSKDNTAKPPHLLQIIVWTQPGTGMSLSKYAPNYFQTTSCLSFVAFDALDTAFTTIIDSGATNSFLYS